MTGHRDDQDRRDPTHNVLLVVDLANKRQDDLREAELRRIDELAQLRADYARELADAEAKRLDAIRQIDVTAVRTEADRSLAAIQTLAATTATNAENLRNALTSTAAAIAKQTSDTVSGITERIGALEKSSYEGKGKEAVADPLLAELIVEVRALSKSSATDSGKSAGISVSWSVLVAIVLIVIAFGTMMYARPTPQQVIYAPAPSTK